MPGPGQSQATRERIVDAAAEVIERLGLARATTREIARAAGYSEATSYKHFRDKGELVLEVVSERLPQFVAALKRLLEHPGEGTVEGNLADLAAEAVAFLVALAGRVPPGIEPHDTRFAAGVAATVLRGLAPRHGAQ
jgi:AcrR family transcriptional regulator